MSLVELADIKSKLIEEINNKQNIKNKSDQRISDNPKSVWAIFKNTNMMNYFYKPINMDAIEKSKNKIIEKGEKEIDGLIENDIKKIDKDKNNNSEKNKLMIDILLISNITEIYQKLNKKDYEEINKIYNIIEEKIKIDKKYEQEIINAFENKFNIKINNKLAMVYEIKRLAREKNKEKMKVLFKLRPDLWESFLETINQLDIFTELQQ